MSGRPPPGAYGFIGLGNMGRPMAANVVRAGLPVVGFDAAGVADRLPAGAAAASSVADVAARTDAIFLSLPDGAAVLAVVDGIAAAPDRRAGLVIDLSTIGIGAAKDAAARCRAAGLDYADCPVSGGQVGAGAATISTMWAGDGEQLERHRPALAALSKNIFHVSDEPGQGQALKLLNNFLSATAVAATSEAVQFGLAQGLDMQTILEVVNVSSGQSYGSSTKFPRFVATGAWDSWFDIALMAKDVTLFEESQAALDGNGDGDGGARNRIGRLMAEIWRDGAAAIPDGDHMEIYRVIAGEAGPSKRKPAG